MQIRPVTFGSQREDQYPGRPLELAATLYLPDKAATGERAPGLVVGHGAGSRGSSHDEFCRVACSCGFVVLALDFRGHGASGGRANGPLEQDLLAAARFLRAQPSVGGQVCYRGSSMGGFYGLKAAAAAGFAALVLVCPASEQVLLDGIEKAEESAAEPKEPAAQEPPFWDADPLRRYFLRQDSLHIAAGVRCPVLLLHARGDDVVPLTHSLRLTEGLQGETTLIAFPGGSHTSIQHDPAVHRLTLEWLQARLRATDE